MTRTLVAALVCWLALFAAAHAAGDRVALVIGNATYLNAGTLANPLNDATDLAAALEGIGFEVSRASDLDAVGMRSALKAFRDAAQGAEVAVIFYAGHGLEIDGQNYLVPVDAALTTESDVLYDAIPLDLLIEAASGTRALSLVIVDACRNNPFAARLARSSRSLGRGLSPVEPAAGTLVAFAARAGTIANDGAGRNSPFTTALLRHVGEPGLDISLLFRRVRDDVMAATLNQQEPFVYGSLPGREIYLVPPGATAVSPPPAAGTSADQEEFAWSLVKDSVDSGRLTAFITAFPRGTHAEEAIERLKTLSGPATPAVQIVPLAPGEALTVPGSEEVPVGTEIAGEERTALAAEPAEAATQEPGLTSLIQAELNRIGCSVGAPDGIWGRRSQAGLERFAAQTGRAVDSLLRAPPLLALLKEQPAGVCPIVCTVRQTLIEGRCVLKSCPAGQRLSSKGICYTPVATPKEEPVAEEPKKKRDLNELPSPSLCSLC